MKQFKSLAAIGAGLCALGLAAGGSAAADTNPGNTTTYAAVGSDTTQDVMESLSGVVLSTTGAPLLSNYMATPTGTQITTNTGNANCTFDRPANSGQGRDALSAAMRGVAFGHSAGSIAGCVNVARSSSNGNPTTSPGVGSMTYIPFATDAVTYAVQASSLVPKRLGKADLVAIYSANTPNCVLLPLLPTIGSGTREFFLGQLGFTNNKGAIGSVGGPGTCVKDTTAFGGAIQEHDGRFLSDPSNLIPFSVAQDVAQGSDAIANQLGSAALGAIDATSDPNLANAKTATVLRGDFPFARPVYNVVPTAKLTSDAAFAGVFSGPQSKICLAGSTIEKLGFAQRLTDCGDTTFKNNN